LVGDAQYNPTPPFSLLLHILEPHLHPELHRVAPARLPANLADRILLSRIEDASA